MASSISRSNSGMFDRNAAIFRRLSTLSELIDSEAYIRKFYTANALRPGTRAAVQSSSESAVKNEKNQFQVMLNASHFKPNEIEVKVVDNYIVVHGKHEEISDEHGFIQREFTRRYMLPEGVEADTVKSSWSTHGILTIEASNKAIASNERVVPISISFKTY